MNWPSINFDWNQARAFLATAEEGSLSAAARALGQTQPTLSRQVSSLEEDLGVTLFERIGKSLTLTQQGEDLLEHFRAMGEAANQVSISASGQSQSIAGEVSITATDAMAAFFLPEVLRELQERAPEIEVHIVASNEVRDLRRREVDIALRHIRPEEPDLFARLLRESNVQFYASTDYLARRGRPNTLEDAKEQGHSFIAFDPIERFLGRLQGQQIHLPREMIRTSTDNGVVMCELIRAGIGIGMVPEEFAERTPGIEPVLDGLPPLIFPVWLTTHRELRTSRRIRLVFDHLADAFRGSRSH